MVASYSEAKSRDAARKTLHDLWVQEPGHIDLDLFTAAAGLHVIEGGLATADGRIVAGQAQRGFIRVRAGINNTGRRRFIVAHELGHFHLHKRQSYTDTHRELSTYRTGNIETEANVFAAELLMPGFLFKPRIEGRDPSHALLQGLATEFSTSHLATIIQFITYTREPCALVVSKDAVVQWSRPSPSWEWPLRDGTLHRFSGAGEFFNSGNAPKPGMIETPAGAWIPQFSAGGDETIREDAFAWPEQQIVLSLLWVDDEL